MVRSQKEEPYRGVRRRNQEEKKYPGGVQKRSNLEEESGRGTKRTRKSQKEEPVASKPERRTEQIRFFSRNRMRTIQENRDESRGGGVGGVK